MATPEQLTRELDPAPYDVPYVSRLLVGSFFHAQGDSDTQEAILLFLASRFSSGLEFDTVIEAIEPAVKSAHTIYLNPQLHRVTDGVSGREEATAIVTDMTNKLVGMVEIRKVVEEDGQDLLYDSDLGDLTKKIITQDRYILGPHPYSGGRLRQRSEKINRYSDANLSQWVYFGLMGQTTGISEYDTMFDCMVRDFVEQGGYDDDHIRRSADLVTHHLTHHPSQIELLPEQWRPSGG